MHTDQFWKRIERFPPILLRLLARHPHGQPLTGQEIAKNSGLTDWQVNSLSWSTTWEGVDIYQLRNFMIGCGVDLTNSRQMKRIEVYLRGRMQNGQRIPPQFTYLKRHPWWSEYYQPLMRSYMETLK